MKYIVLEVTDHDKAGEVVRHIPIVFPDLLVHSQMAQVVATLLRKEGWENGLTRDVKPLSAGFIRTESGFCFGKSESLGLVSRGVLDAALISTFDYLQGIQP